MGEKKRERETLIKKRVYPLWTDFIRRTDKFLSAFKKSLFFKHFFKNSFYPPRVQYLRAKTGGAACSGVDKLLSKDIK